MPIRSAPGIELRLGLHHSALIYAYCRWRAEGLFALIFHRDPEMTLQAFLDWNYQTTVEPVGCYVGDRLVGIGWICQAHRVAGKVVAEVGAAFFRGTPLHEWRQALDLFVQHAFVEREFDAIYGISAARNPAAAEILRFCGMTPAERLPWGQQVSEDTVIFQLDRGTWRKRGIQ